MESKDGLPIKSFKNAKAWEAWLKKNQQSGGLWLMFYKKDAGVATVTYPEAVETALCYGWIDGQANKLDERAYLQRFTPRRPKGLWSKKNVERAEKLIAAGRMKPGGLKEVEAAKADGRWDAAYDAPANSEIPKDFLKLLSKNAKAKKFFAGLNKTNRFAITWRLQTAMKPATREKRMQVIMGMLERGETYH